MLQIVSIIRGRPEMTSSFWGRRGVSQKMTKGGWGKRGLAYKVSQRWHNFWTALYGRQSSNWQTWGWRTLGGRGPGTLWCTPCTHRADLCSPDLKISFWIRLKVDVLHKLKAVPNAAECEHNYASSGNFQPFKRKLENSSIRQINVTIKELLHLAECIHNYIWRREFKYVHNMNYAT